MAGILLLGLSCSGPSPESSTPAPTEERPARVYHVQLDMVQDKTTADQMLGQALAWWKDRSDTVPAPLERKDGSEAPVAIHWQAPLYRVRIGPFASRSAAEEVLAAAETAFPEAFVAPERLRPAP